MDNTLFFALLSVSCAVELTPIDAGQALSRFRLPLTCKDMSVNLQVAELEQHTIWNPE